MLLRSGATSQDSLQECCAEAKKEAAMTFIQHRTLSRLGFCLCCVAAAGCAATGGWLSPSQAYAEARNIVDLIRDDAAKAPIKLHKLRRDVSILEGSGGNIAVLTGADRSWEDDVAKD
jgi:hypothetical protein